VCVAIALAIGACDLSGPDLTVSESPSRWLHDEVFVDVDGTLDDCTSTFRDAEGVELESYSFCAGASLSFTAQLSHEVELAGRLTMTVSGTDDHGDPFDASVLDWDVPTWSQDELPLRESATGAPLVVATRSWAGYGDWHQKFIVLVPEADGIQGVYRDGLGKWDPVTAAPIDATNAAAAADEDGVVYLVSGDTAFAILHDRIWDVEQERPSVGPDPRIAVSAWGKLAIAGAVSGNEVDVATVREIGTEWETSSVTATSIVGGPAVAFAANREEPYVAFFDQAGDRITLRVLGRYQGDWQTFGEVEVAQPIGSPALAPDADGVVVAWTDDGTVSTAHVGLAGMRMMPSPGDADDAPQLASNRDVVDRESALVVSMLDGGTVVTFRWDEESWTPLAGSSVSGEQSSTALWDGHVPITAWRDGDAVRVALYNGEVP